MTIGLDASTRVVGWSMCSDGKVLDAGFVDTSKLKTNKEKSFRVISILDSNPLISHIDKINLEAALSGFGGRRTSQQTIILLSRWNAVFEYILSEHYKLPVNLISASTARKKVFGKALIKGVKSKDYVKMMIPKAVPNVNQFEKMNTRGRPDERNGDIYDAMVMGLF